MSLPFARYLNLVYFFATEDADEKDKNRFDIRLNMPDERAQRKMREQRVIDDSSPWSKKNEEKALSAFVGSLRGET